MPLANSTGMLEVKRPNKNQSRVPNANNAYMLSDIPEVFFVLIVFIACGKKEIVVHKAAASPRMVTLFILKSSYFISERKSALTGILFSLI